MIAERPFDFKQVMPCYLSYLPIFTTIVDFVNSGRIVGCDLESRRMT